MDGMNVELRRTASDTTPVFGGIDAADGVALRTAAWGDPDAPRGTVILLGGRSEFLEKYQETAAALVARGFHVRSMDWRGHGLSGGRPADNPQKNHVDDFALLADDLDRFADSVIRTTPTRPLVLLAHSMGGLVATLHLARRPDLYAAAILSAPMFDIHTGGVPRWAARLLAAQACAAGRARDYAPGQRDYDWARDSAFLPENRITSDHRRWRVFHDAYRDRPDLRVGGVTYGWIRAALRASDLVQTALPLHRVETPVLILSAPDDRIVDARAHEVVRWRLPDCALRSYPGSKHEPLMERDAIRDAVWADIDAFLALAVPPLERWAPGKPLVPAGFAGSGRPTRERGPHHAR